MHVVVFILPSYIDTDRSRIEKKTRRQIVKVQLLSDALLNNHVNQSVKSRFT